MTTSASAARLPSQRQSRWQEHRRLFLRCDFLLEFLFDFLKLGVNIFLADFLLRLGLVFSHRLDNLLFRLGLTRAFLTPAEAKLSLVSYGGGDGH